LVQKIGNGLSPERGLEGKIQLLADGTFKQAFAFMPGRAVGLQL